MQQKNLILFIVLSVVILFGSLQLQKWLNPNAGKQPAKPAEKAAAAPPKKAPAQRIHLPQDGHAVEPGIPLGDAQSKLRAVLDPWGAGVRSVTLNQFQTANALGKPVRLNGQGVPLEFIQGDKNLRTPSNLLYHFDPKDPNSSRPLSTLGQIKWDVIEPKDIVPGQVIDRAVFAATVGDVRVTKTFSLGKDDYHIGLEIKVELLDGKQAQKFRYQIAGSHGTHMEGEWFTGTHRDALILQVNRNDRERVDRRREDLRLLSHRSGGDEVTKAQDMLIRYGGVITQYFASVVVVDDKQDEGVGRDFIARARPTVETAWIRGRIDSIGKDGRSFELDTTPEPGLFSGAPRKEIHTVVLPGDVQLPPGVGEKMVVAVNYTMDEHDQMLAADILGPSELNRLYFDDITVRLSTEEIKLEPGKPVAHKYLLYNGPVKVHLLSQLTGEMAVPEELVNRYENELRLDTFTDYHSNGIFGDIAGAIGWTRLLIWCTNLMHGILWYIHLVIPNYGLCIILLTILVRAAMFPLSRKQTIASQRMQEKMAKLKPEIEKLKEKHKNDPQRLKQEQTELMLRHGMINPLGSCWIALLQMPIFMGLYFALQESIHFRLAPFLWIDNLAAPDMLFPWGQSIPIISSPSNYSGGLLSILYLGPFFNLLPIIAVAFMIVQQQMMMPPATDEQTATQQKMMKYMTIFFGLMFYKVAAGLCIYFIISSSWGFGERKLLPKKASAAGGGPPEPTRGRFSRWILDRMEAAREGQGGADTAPRPQASNGAASADARERRKAKKPQRRGGREAPENSNGALQKLRAWWQQVLKEARKK